MKVKYTCEVCGAEFNTPDEAKKCESKHDLLRKKDELKAKSEEAIAEMVNRHIQTFKEFPSVELSEESQKIIHKAAGEAFIDILEAVVDAICDDKEGNDDEDDKEEEK